MLVSRLACARGAKGGRALGGLAPHTPGGGAGGGGAALPAGAPHSLAALVAWHRLRLAASPHAWEARPDGARRRVQRRLIRAVLRRVDRLRALLLRLGRGHARWRRRRRRRRRGFVQWSRRGRVQWRWRGVVAAVAAVAVVVRRGWRPLSARWSLRDKLGPRTVGPGGARSRRRAVDCRRRCGAVGRGHRAYCRPAYRRTPRLPRSAQGQGSGRRCARRHRGGAEATRRRGA